MRTLILLPCLLLSSLMTFAQQSPSTQTSPNAVSAGGTGAITVIGCVSSINGYFTLGTRRGDLYRLKGDHDSLLGYNGQEVAISGRVKSSEKGRSLEVSKIKKVSDTCQY